MLGEETIRSNGPYFSKLLLLVFAADIPQSYFLCLSSTIEST